MTVSILSIVSSLCPHCVLSSIICEQELSQAVIISNPIFADVKCAKNIWNMANITENNILDI